MNTNQTKEGWEERTKKKLLKELDFISDHWVKGDDRPPFNFGGWREEVAENFIEITKDVSKKAEQRVAMEILKIAKLASSPGYSGLELLYQQLEEKVKHQYNI